MKEIDWSKAPEGATHWGAPTEGIDDQWAEAFYKQAPDGRWLISLSAMSGWHGDASTNHDWPERLASLTPRPTAWTGEGNPPEGTVCEYSFEGRNWYECTIRYVLAGDQDPDADGWRAVVWCPHLGKDQVSKPDLYRFRPLRTPEQIAAEERLHKVRNACTAIADTLDSLRGKTKVERAALAVVEAMIDAGYTRVEP